MRAHFHLSELREIHNVEVHFFDPTVDNEDLIVFFRPLVVEVYNEYLRNRIAPNFARRAGLPQIQHRLRSHVPTVESLMKGEFGEVVGTLHIERFEDKIVPTYKHSHKTSPNVPFHGMDCIAIEIMEEEDETRLRFYFCEIKTTEAETDYPDVSYQIRESFLSLNSDEFELEISFILRQLEAKRDLSDNEELIVELLEMASYEQSDLFLCPYLIADTEIYRPTYPVPFCNAQYSWPLQPKVIRFPSLNEVYLAVMRTN